VESSEAVGPSKGGGITGGKSISFALCRSRTPPTGSWIPRKEGSICLLDKDFLEREGKGERHSNSKTGQV